MKCAVLTASEKLVIEEREVPVVGPFDVLIAVEVCGVCRTDRKAFVMGQRDLTLPRVLGHEIVGRIVELGNQVKNHQAGELVQVFPGVTCGSCEYCLTGLDHLCDKMQIIGFHLDGGFAEYLCIRGQGSEPPNLSRVPETLDPRSASLTEPLACSINMSKRLNMGEAETVLIIGAGPLGILNAQLASVLGARNIIIAEPLKARRVIAAKVSDCQLDSNEQTAEQVLELTHGRGADVVIPCASGSAPFRLALQTAAKRGRVGFFSGLTDISELTGHVLNSIHYRELTLTGSYGCSSAGNHEALGLLASGRVSMNDIPSRDISWSELPTFLRCLEPTEQSQLSGHVFTFFLPSQKASE
ncbi:MAG: alcohol dehydrogenase catalytic domain-containing protein [Coriobacteriia bacterium]|nr:alcohol dehydrogenase catalytic domain-containing protein [Coriobacteriia bacterium]